MPGVVDERIAVSKKPGLFSRLKNSISGALNDAVDAVSDPGQEVALMLDDLAENIKQSEQDLKQAMVDRKMLERKMEECEEKERDWQKKAEHALKLGDEDLARAALKQKAEYSTRRVEHKAAQVQQAEIVDSMGKQIKESKAKLKSLNLRRGSLMAQARAAKKGLAPGQLDDGSTGDRMNDIENRIAQIEALNEVTNELGGAAEEAALDAKFDDLDDESELDDELAALKAKMNQASLPAGKESKAGADSDDSGGGEKKDD